LLKAWILRTTDQGLEEQEVEAGFQVGLAFQIRLHGNKNRLMDIQPVEAKKGSIGCRIEWVRQAINNERNRSGGRRATETRATLKLTLTKFCFSN
jgi:hypothetical protein